MKPINQTKLFDEMDYFVKNIMGATCCATSDDARELTIKGKTKRGNSNEIVVFEVTDSDKEI